MTTYGDEAPVIFFPDAAAFEAWLEEHVEHQPGVWLKVARKSSGIASLTDDEAVDVGLCFGWISGQRKGLDETHYLQKYVPRRPRSRWSQVNVRKVEELLAAGRMRPAGLAEVEAARADGRWDAAYVSQKEATVPPDLATPWRARPPRRPRSPRSGGPSSTPSSSTWSPRARPRPARPGSPRPSPAWGRPLDLECTRRVTLAPWA